MSEDFDPKSPGANLVSEGLGVYKAINKIQEELNITGITKDRRSGQGYQFRGIDDVYNALSPLLAKHGLCILPRFVSRECEVRSSRQGGDLFFVTVEAEFDLVCSEDGSCHTIRTYGEAMDSSDKGTNKAMSAAYKYAAFQAFAIPTEGDHDTENNHHQPGQQQYQESYNQGAATPELVCAGCRKDLSKSQFDLSMRKYGRALCPECQKSGQAPASTPEASSNTPTKGILMADINNQLKVMSKEDLAEWKRRIIDRFGATDNMADRSLGELSALCDDMRRYMNPGSGQEAV